MDFPVDGLAFDPDLVIRGLFIDKERGNLVKADRYGYVKRAMHGSQMLSTQSVSEMYGREPVDLQKENRWEFLNTLFSVLEAVAYMQAVGKALFRAHVEGQLKSEIMSKPELFVEPDPKLPLALLDQKEVIVSARKPEFFQMSHPLYEVVTDEGLMRPCFKARSGAVVSASVGDNLAGAEIDHDTLGFKHFKLNTQGENFGVLADIFASVSLSAQRGNFQRLFLDLTRLYARLDFPSGSKVVSGATRLAN